MSNYQKNSRTYKPLFKNNSTPDMMIYPKNYKFKRGFDPNK